FVEAGLAAAAGQREQAGEVADRRVEPDVEVLARVAGDLEAEVGRVAGNVPVAQAALGVDPFTQLGLDAGDGDFALQPVAQHRGEVADLEEEMLGRAQLGGGAGDHRARFLQFGGRIGRAAGLAVVAVLVGRAAARADALDVAVGQEHRLDRVVELLDRAAFDVAACLERAVEALGQFPVLGRVGGVVAVEVDAEVGDVALLAGLETLDEVLGRDAGLLRGEHDRRAVGIVGADEVDGAARQAARAHPDVGVDVADQVADVQVAVAVGQGAGDDGGAVHVDGIGGELGLSHAACGTAGAAPAVRGPRGPGTTGRAATAGSTPATCR